jgi:hypothetical protein
MALKHYSPPPFVARRLRGEAGNLACHCATVAEGQRCREGHLFACHAGMTCKEAQCCWYLTTTGAPWLCRD